MGNDCFVVVRHQRKGMVRGKKQQSDQDTKTNEEEVEKPTEVW